MSHPLNESQYAAATHLGGPLLVLAGAGSGKTRVLTERIRFLISQGVPPTEIMAVTFTNKAAREILHRLGPDGKDVQAGTFHGLAARLCRAHGVPSSSFRILDEDDSYRVFRDLARELVPDIDKAQIREGYDLLMTVREQGQDPGPDPGEIVDVPSLVAKVQPLYTARLEELDSLDFPGLLLALRDLARDTPDLQAKFQHILVDEYQDTNPIQDEIVSLLGSEWNNPMVVGDPGQGIYSWRGADPANLLEFPDRWPGTTVIKLEENYRSVPAILDVANVILDGMANDRFAFRLRPTRKNLPKADHVVTYVADNEWNEAERVARNIAALLARGRTPDQFAVIYRSNYQSRALERHLSLLGIPYRIVGGLTLYERAEVRDALAYLRIWADRGDDPAIARVLNVPSRGIGEKTAALLGVRDLWRTLVRAVGQTTDAAPPSRLAAMLQKAGAKILPTAGQGLLKGKALSGVRDFLSSFEGMPEDETKTCADLLITILARVGYAAHMAKDEEKERDRCESIAHLKDLLTVVPMTKQALRQFVQDAALAEEQAKDKSEAAVTLTTAHSAKGLEWPIVYAVGWEEGTFPSPRSDMEEERRLAYVIVTRARDKLFLGCAAQRLQESRDPSRFLIEVRDRIENDRRE